MEFKFNINELFKQPIVEVNSNLIPHGFSGDRRALLNTVSKVAQVVDGIGEASAAAQGLTKPITSADRLRNSEHKLYLLIDQAGNDGKGVVTGMLKIGTKGLYVFDREGTNHQVKPACVLDFYVHESRQRNGLGKQLFEHMLQKEQHEPVKMAIDRPSEKFLGFLNKHYNLNSPIKQMNNYVVFDGFFPGGKKNGFSESNNNNNNNNSDSPGKKQYISSNSANGLQNVTTPYGRYGAPRPPCSMGQIIHNQSATVQNTQETTGDIQVVVDEKVSASPKLERPRSLSIQLSEDQQQPVETKEDDDGISVTAEEEDVEKEIEKITLADVSQNLTEPEKTAATGGKKTPSHLTEQGFFDLKFYHNKLW